MSLKKNRDPEPENPRQTIAQLRGDLLTIGRRVTHDLRTPLGAISISIELIKETLAGNDAAVSAVKSLNSSMDELTRLIKSLSIVAKATAHPSPLEKVAMGEIVLGVTQQLERLALERSATVTMSGPHSWPDVSGHRGWLEFIWWNFLANALQHGGLKIELGWSRENGHFRFWIRDDGNAVSAGTRAHLFQPFDSLHQPDSTRGLGLSIVQRLVELQDGRCGYEEAAGGGSCFFFTLPDTIR